MTHSSFNIVNTVYTELKKRCEVAPPSGTNTLYTRLPDKRYQNEERRNSSQMILHMLRSWNTVLFSQLTIYRLSGLVKV